MSAVVNFPVQAERELPHDIAAEQSVLGALMLSQAALTSVSDWLTADDFYRRDHQLIYRAICGLAERNVSCDAVTLADWFEASGLSEMIPSLGYLLEVANATASPANVVAYAEIVVERSRLRAAVETGEKLVQSALRPGADSSDVIGTATHELSSMHASKLRGGLESTKAGLSRMFQEMQLRVSSPGTLLGMPWPWLDLNKCTKGLRDGVLYIVGARPSMGKSIFAVQTAVHTALRGDRVALFSVEMSAEECMARATACVGEVPHEWVESPDNESEDSGMYWGRVSRTIADIKDSPLLIDDTPGITIDQLNARVRRAHLQKPVRLVIVDHMHDMTLDPKRETRHEYGRIAQGAKALAKDLKCPVILCAQLNRQLGNRADKRPGLMDLRESGEIEQKADVVLFLHRDDYYDPETHLKGVVEVIPAKGRNIRLGNTIYLQNTFSQMRMQDWIGDIPAPPEVEAKKPASRGFGGRRS